MEKYLRDKIGNQLILNNPPTPVDETEIDFFYHK